MIAYLVVYTVRIGLKLFDYTKANSDLTQAIRRINNHEEVDQIKNA